TPLTPEAGIVRVADALDMEQGRSRLSYHEGERSIDTVSSQAINKVTVMEGDEKPVMVEIELNNSAGVYQIDNLLKSKLRGSGLEGYTKIVAINKGEDDIVGRIEL
ncbi:MAG: phosphohydrolase, partial [Halobacteria archaeon]|nr:phosphohydrolase [Halobacteria archaeon]